MPVVCYRLISSNLIAITRYLSLSEQTKAAANQSFSIRGISLLSLCSGHGVPLLWLTLITITTGMCLMNEYSLFKVQSHSPHIAENRCGDFYVPSPVSSLICILLSGYFKISFNFFTALSIEYFTATFEHPSSFAICS